MVRPPIGSRIRYHNPWNNTDDNWGVVFSQDYGYYSLIHIEKCEDDGSGSCFTTVNPFHVLEVDVSEHEQLKHNVQ